MPYKPIFIAASSQHVGKTTTTLGLASAFNRLGYNVGYCKPVGQKHINVDGVQVDKDTVLFADLLKFDIDPKVHSPVILGSGATKRLLSDYDPSVFQGNIIRAKEQLEERHDIIIYEGTGHPGVGSVGNVSNAQVAKMLNCHVIMVVPGGIGSTIDMLNLCLSLFREQNVPILGVIINKVLPEKADTVKTYVSEWLKAHNLRLLGVIPYDPTLAYPLVWTAAKAIEGEIEQYNERGYQKVENVIAGSLAENKDFEGSINNLLVAGPRNVDQAIKKIVAYAKAEKLQESPLSGVVVTGDEPLSRYAQKYINVHKIPLIRTQLDTYGAAVKMSKIEVKINRRTPWKITKAIELIRENSDIPQILKLIES